MVSNSFQLLAVYFSCLFISASLLTFQLFAYSLLSSTKATVYSIHFIFLFGDMIVHPLLPFSYVVMRGTPMNVQLAPDDVAPCPCPYIYFLVSVNDYDMVEVPRAIFM